MGTRLVTALLVLACVHTGRADYRRFGVPLPVTTAKAAGWFTNQYGNWNWHNIKAGDLDNDGRLEFVLVNTQWEIYAVDDLAACTTAGDPSATLLWQINNPAGNVKAIGDNPWLVDLRAWQGWHPQSFAVWDLDDDGRCEVAATWRLPDSQTYVCVFSGADGSRRARSRTPIESGFSSAIEYNVGVADFSGDSRPHDIYCFIDETGFVYAYHYTPGDSLLTTLWSHVSGPGKTPTDLTGHQGVPYDIDGDRRDEFVANGALDHDGQVIFSFCNRHQSVFTWWGTYMHADNSAAADILPGRPGIELLIAPCDDALPSVITDPSGAILVNPRDSAFATPTPTHTETFNLCRFRRDIAGLQYACEPKFTSNIMVVDCSGRTVARIPVAGMQAALDWDGERSQDELLVMSEAAVGVYAARDTTYGANSFGYVGLVREVREGYHQYGYPLPIDICGDFREEVVYNSYDSIIVIQNLNANPNGPYPSPTTFDTYMKRYTQLGFGAYAYYPYSEYSGPVSVAGQQRGPVTCRARAGDDLHVYTLQGQRVAGPWRPGASGACGVYVCRTATPRDNGYTLAAVDLIGQTGATR